MQVASRNLQIADCRLQVAGYKLQVASCRFSVVTHGSRMLQVVRVRLLASNSHVAGCIVHKCMYTKSCCVAGFRKVKYVVVEFMMYRVADCRCVWTGLQIAGVYGYV